jgi:replication initiation protein RepC
MKRAISALPSCATEDPEVAHILASFASWPRSDTLSHLGLDRLTCISLRAELSDHDIGKLERFVPARRLSPLTPTWISLAAKRTG